jgi:large subunit ribosomal protein L10
MSKSVKDMMIHQIRERVGENRDLLVVDTARVDAITDNRFRISLRERGIDLIQVKNSLARKALESADVSLDHCLKGPSTLIWGGEDAVALSKELSKWAKELPGLEIKGASVDGQPLDAAGVESLSKSPSRLELLSQIVGLVLSPGARLSGALLGPGAKLNSQLKSMADKEDGGEA